MQLIIVQLSIRHDIHSMVNIVFINILKQILFCKLDHFRMSEHVSVDNEVRTPPREHPSQDQQPPEGKFDFLNINGRQ